MSDAKLPHGQFQGDEDVLMEELRAYVQGGGEEDLCFALLELLSHPLCQAELSKEMLKGFLHGR